MYKYGWDKKVIAWWKDVLYFSNFNNNVMLDYFYGRHNLNK